MDILRSADGEIKTVVYYLGALLALLALLGFVTSDQFKTEFEDSAFEQAIRDKLDKHEGDLAWTDLRKVTHLDALSRGIESLQGIEFLSSLVELNLSDNRIRDLGDIDRLRKLRHLDLSRNGLDHLRIAGIEKLSKTNIRTLDLSYNFVDLGFGNKRHLSEISEISKIKSLKELSLEGNGIRKADDCGGLTRLSKLNLSGNLIEDVSFLSQLVGLEDLNLSSNRIVDISVLEGLNKLRRLDLSSNYKVRNGIEPIASLSGLRFLDLSGLFIGGDLDIIIGLRGLEELVAGNCKTDDPKGLTEFISKLRNARALKPQVDSPVVINEMVSSNIDGQSDVDGEFSDWIELHNRSSRPVLLEGWGLSDREDQRFRWVFPDVTIDADEYLLVWASGKGKSNEHYSGKKGINNKSTKELHSNFAIRSGGESVYLTNPEGSFASVMHPIFLSRNFSQVLLENENSEYGMAHPSPGKENLQSERVEYVQPPVFSRRGGFYTEPFELILSKEDSESTILYTLDGSLPSLENLGGKTLLYKNEYPEKPGDPFGQMRECGITSFKYSNPIRIEDRSAEPNTISEFGSTAWMADWRKRSKTRVPKAVVVRAVTIKPDSVNSEVVSHSYFLFDREIGQDRLPVLSLMTGNQNLFDYETGISTPGKTLDDWRKKNPEKQSRKKWLIPANYSEKGDQWERPANFEYFEVGNAYAVINQETGIRIHGRASCLNRQKSFRLYARNDYGETLFRYPFFNEQKNDTFKHILLRNAGQGNRDFIRDPFAQHVVKDLNIENQDYEPALLFLNGELAAQIFVCKFDHAG